MLYRPCNSYWLQLVLLLSNATPQVKLRAETGSHDQNQNYKPTDSLLQSSLWMFLLRMMQVYDHIVVGAGINGSSAAYQLARRGAEVLLLEKVSSELLCSSLTLIQLFLSSSRSLTPVAVLMDKVEASGRLTPTPSSPRSWRRLTRSGTP